MISIREATIQDIPAVRAVAISSYSDTFSPHNSQENMEKYLDGFYSLTALENEFYEPSTCIFMACEADQLVGFARLRECDEAESLLGENTVELHRIYVLTSAQGKSVGKLLMEASLTYAQEKEYEWIWLGVWERNFKAHRFYEAWGFERFSEHTFWMGDDPQVDWLMCRKP